MGFEFRFERLLAYREELEKRALMDMAQVERRRDQERNGLTALQREVQALGDQWGELKDKSTPMDDIQRLRTRWTALQNDVKRQASILEEWDARLEEARGCWLKARKAKKVLQLLKEKALERYLDAIHKAETKHLDEAALRSHLENAAPCGRP